MTRITPHVLIADDHRLFGEGIARILKEAGYLTTIVTDLAGVEPAIAALQPDVLLLDLSFGKESALPMLRRLREQQPALRILVLTALNEGVIMQAVARAGAGYLSKSESPDAMVNAVDIALSGKRFRRSADVVQVNSQRWVGGVLLTRKQITVLRAIYEGQSTGEIATALAVTVKSVDAHIHALRTRIGVRSRAEIIRWAQAHIAQLGE